MLSFYQWASDKFGKSSTPASAIVSLMRNNPRAPRTSTNPNNIEAFLAKVPVSEHEMKTFKDMFAEYQKSK